MENPIVKQLEKIPGAFGGHFILEFVNIRPCLPGHPKPLIL